MLEEYATLDKRISETDKAASKLKAAQSKLRAAQAACDKAQTAFDRSLATVQRAATAPKTLRKTYASRGCQVFRFESGRTLPPDDAEAQQKLNALKQRHAVLRPADDQTPPAWT